MLEPQKTFTPSLSLEKCIARDPITVFPDTPLKEAIDLMQSLAKKSSFVLVVSEKERQLLGLLTERDLVKLAAAGTKIKGITIARVMTRDLITLSESKLENIAIVLDIFSRHKIRHLPIVDKDNSLVGIVTSYSIRQAMQPVDLLKLSTVADVMNSDVVTAFKDTYVRDLVKLMAEKRVSCVVIVEEEKDIKGVTRQGRRKNIKNKNYPPFFDKSLREMDGLDPLVMKDEEIDSYADRAARTSALISGSFVKPVGIITERDIVKFQALQLDLKTLYTSDVMSSPLFCLSPEDSLWQANQEMEKLGVRRLVVAGSAGELLGIVTQSSLLATLNPLEINKIFKTLKQKIVRLQNEKIELLENRNLELEKEVKQRTAKIQSQADREKQENLLAKMALRIRNSLDRSSILENTVTEVRQLLQAERVIVYQFLPNGSGIVLVESVDRDLPSMLGKEFLDHCFARDWAESYQNGRIQVTADIYNSGLSQCHIDLLAPFKIVANLVVPIVQNEKLWGLLAVQQCTAPREWRSQEIEFVKKLATQVAIAIQQAELYQQLQKQLDRRQKAETEVRQLNIELETRVVDRTAQLYEANRELQKEIIERGLLQDKLQQSEAKIRAILEAMTDIVLVINVKENSVKIAAANNSYLLNSATAKYIDRTVVEFFQSTPLNLEFFQQIQRVLDTNIPVNFEYNLPLEEKLVWFAASISPLSEHSVVWVARDISDRKQSEKQLRAVNQQLASQLEELEQRNRDMILLGKISQFLQACSTLSEAYAGLGEIIYPLFPRTVGGVFIRNNNNLLESVASWGRTNITEGHSAIARCWKRQLQNINRDNYYQYVCELYSQNESFCLPMISAQKTIGIFYFALPDPGFLSPTKRQLGVTVAEQISLGISNLKLRETLQNQSVRDPLTNLFNRRYLEEYLTKEINRSHRHQESLGIVMLDIDYFKKFNDTFGHDAGDEVLRRVSAFILNNIRKSDVACRYGGEELIIILPGANSEQTKQRAEQLREGIKRLKLECGDLCLGQITVSMGVSSFPEHGKSGELLIKAADVALYQAKIQGRDRVVVAKQ